jgi:hypothetical protein
MSAAIRFVKDDTPKIKAGKNAENNPSFVRMKSAFGKTIEKYKRKAGKRDVEKKFMFIQNFIQNGFTATAQKTKLMPHTARHNKTMQKDKFVALFLSFAIRYAARAISIAEVKIKIALFKS